VVTGALIGGSLALAAYLASPRPGKPASGSNAGGRRLIELAPLALGDLINPAEARRLSRVCQMTVAAVRLALDDAGLTSCDGVGLVVGTEFGDLRSSIEFVDGYLDRGPAGLSALLFPNTVMNTMAGAAAIAVSIKEMSLTLNAPTIAGELAVARAAAMIGSGRLAAALAGGVDEMDPRLRGWLAALGATSEMRGEGATFLVLESRTAAGIRGARVLGTIRGAAWGALPAPPGGVGRRSTSHAIAEALEGAQAHPEEIGWGYGSADGDRARADWEDRLLATALGSHRPPMTSLSARLGAHAGLGALQVAAGAWTARSGLLPWTDDATRAETEGAPAGDLARVRPGPGIVHGIARGGAQVTLVIGPPES